MVLPELSRTMTYTTRNTVTRLLRKQLHFNHVVSERTKGGINLYIELEKHKLNQIYASNKNLSRQMHSFLDMISVIRIYILYLHAVLIKRRARRHNI